MKKIMLSIITLSVLALAGFNTIVYSFGEIKSRSLNTLRLTNRYQTQSLEDRLKIVNLNTEVDLNNIEEYAKVIKGFGGKSNYLNVRDNDRHLMICFMAKQLKNTKICISSSKAAFSASIIVMALIHSNDGIEKDIFGHYSNFPDGTTQIFTQHRGMHVNGKNVKDYVDNYYFKVKEMPHNIKNVMHRKFVTIVAKDMIKKFGANFSLINTYQHQDVASSTASTISHEGIHSQMRKKTFLETAGRYLLSNLTQKEIKYLASQLTQLPYYRHIADNFDNFVNEVGTCILTPNGWREAENDTIPQIRAIAPLLKKHHLPMKKYMIKHGHKPIEIKW